MKNFHPDLLDLDACIYFSTLLLFKKSPLIKQLKFWLDGPKWELNFIFCLTLWFRFTPLTLTIVIIMDNRKRGSKIKPPAQGGALNITIAACPAFCCILLQLGGIVLLSRKIMLHWVTLQYNGLCFSSWWISEYLSCISCILLNCNENFQFKIDCIYFYLSCIYRISIVLRILCSWIELCVLHCAF